MMSRIINFLSNTDLIKVVIAISTFLLIVISIMRQYIEYGGLFVTIFYVILFIFLFFTSALIFFDKEEAKNIWIMFGLGFLTGFWNIFG